MTKKGRHTALEIIHHCTRSITGSKPTCDRVLFLDKRSLPPNIPSLEAPATRRRADERV